MREPDDHIQPPRPSHLQNLPADNPYKGLDFEDDDLEMPPASRHLLPALLFGGVAGLIMGALAGEAVCWLSGQDAYQVGGTLIGAVPGAILGLIVAFAERMIRGILVKPDIATILGCLIGILPALIAGFAMNSTHGALSSGLIIEALIGGPISGLLIGGLLDRTYEAFRGQSRHGGMRNGIIAMTVCSILGGLMVFVPLGPDPDGLAKSTRRLILGKWDEDPIMREATIKKIELFRKDGRHFTGFFVANIRGQDERFSLDVFVDEQLVSAHWEPSGP